MQTRSSIFALAGLALAAGLALPETAQAQFRRGGFRGAPRFSQAGVFGQHMRSVNFSRSPGRVLGAIGGLNYLYGGGYGYGGGPTIDAGTAAEIIKAQSEAVKAAEKAKQEKKDRQRQVFEEMQLEQARNLRHAQEYDRQQRARRSAEGVAVPEVASGWALNDLFDEVTKIHRTTGLRGPDVPLDPAALRHVHYTGAGISGGFGLFQAGKPLEWPAVLASDAFKAERAHVEKAVPAAVSEAASGAAQKPTVRELNLAVTGMRERLKEVRDEVPGMDYLKALEYLRKVEDSAVALGQAQAAQLLNGSLAAAGTAVADWVEDMANKGLKVAAATPGDEAHYAALYQAMLSYTEGLNQMAGH